MRKQEFSGNRLVRNARPVGEPNLLVELCDTLADVVHDRSTQTGDRVDTSFANIETKLVAVEERLDALRQDHMIEQYTRQELAEFFVYLNLQASTLDNLRSCHDACQAIDWGQLVGKRF
jgi:hypothetical protein